MVNIDYIMNLFDWNNSDDDQTRGLKLAEDIKCISAFIQPGSIWKKRLGELC